MTSNENNSKFVLMILKKMFYVELCL